MGFTYRIVIGHSREEAYDLTGSLIAHWDTTQAGRGAQPATMRRQPQADTAKSLGEEAIQILWGLGSSDATTNLKLLAQQALSANY